MPRQEVIIRSLLILSFTLLLPDYSVAQTSKPRNSAEAAQQRAAAEQKLAKAKADLEKKEKELTEQKKTAEDAEKEVSDNVNVDNEIKKLEEEIRKLVILKNKVLNNGVLTPEDKAAEREAMGSDTAPVAPELKAQIIEDEIKAKKEKLKKLKELQADPDRDKKRKAAEEKLKNAKARIQELETELENDRAELTKLADDVEEKRKTEQRLREEEKARAARRKKAAAEAEAKAAQDGLATAVEEQKAAVNKVDEERKKIESRKELAKLMAKGFRLISDAVKKLAKLAAGDLGEAIAELATLQLKIGADILDELDGLISNLDGIKRTSNGHYVATRAGDIQLNKFIEALNKLVDANKKLKAALDRAKRAKQNLVRINQGNEALHRQQQQMNKSIQKSNLNDASYSFMPNSHQQLTTSEGQQRLAIVNLFAIGDDLAGLREFVRSQSASISAGDSSGETQFVQSIATNVISEADQTIKFLTDTYDASQAATTPVAAADAFMESLMSSRTTQTSLYGSYYGADVARQFQGSILQEVEQHVSQARNVPSSPGSNVIKGTAALPDQGGIPPDAVVTVSFSLFDDEGKNQGEQSQITKPDKDGNYEFQLPENAKPNEVKIASRDLVEIPSIDIMRSGSVADGGIPLSMHSTSIVHVLRYEIKNTGTGDLPKSVPNEREQVLASQLDELIFSRPDQFPNAVQDPYRFLVPMLIEERISQIVENGKPAATTPKVPDNSNQQTGGGDLHPRPRGLAFVMLPPGPLSNAQDFGKFRNEISQTVNGTDTNVKITEFKAIKIPPSSASSDPLLGRATLDDANQQGVSSTVPPVDGVATNPPTLVIIKYIPRVGAGGNPLNENEESILEMIVRQGDANSGQSKTNYAEQFAQANERLQRMLAETVSDSSGTVKLQWTESDFSRDGEGMTPSDPNYTSTGSWNQEYADQWALHRVGGDPESKVWLDETSDAETCIVAVVGSGVDWTHPELMGQMWRNLDEIPGNDVDDDENGYIDDVWGWNFRGDNARVMDQGGHDTHIAGVIAARWDNRGIAGVNPHSRIMALKVANQLAQSDSISIARAIIYAADNGARVINISYGGPAPSRVEQAAIHYATDKGALVVVAAGNKSKDASKYALAGASGVLTVAGTTLEDKRAPFSNYGFPIDIAAPAMDVLGLRARGTDFLLYVAENNEYVGGTGIVGKDRDLYRASGTSFAAPLVSGAASLLFSQNSSLTNQDVAAMLLSSASDVEVAGKDQYSGFGLLNMSQAMLADPNDFLSVTISKVAPARVDGNIIIQVHGSISGARLEERRLQVAFGENPEEKDWTIVTRSFDRVQGTLGQIPVRFFTKKGVWSIRVTAKSLSGNSNEARATININ